MKKILLLVFALLCMFGNAALAEEEPLFIAQEGWEQGFINAQGEWVIAPEYEEVFPFTSAGYAAVVKTPADRLDPFMVIDRQGNVVADLPEWSLDVESSGSVPHEFDIVNAAGNAFVIHKREEPAQYALYLAGTGKLINLDWDYLGPLLGVGAEEDEEAAKDEHSREEKLGIFSLSEWNDSVILQFGMISENWVTHAFVVIDNQGHFLTDRIYFCPEYEDDGYPHRYPDKVTASYLLANDLHFGYHMLNCDGKSILEEDLGDTLWKCSRSFKDGVLTVNDEGKWEEPLLAVYEKLSDKVVLPDGQLISAAERLKQYAPLNPCGIVMHNNWYYNAQGERAACDEVNEKKYTPLTAFGRDGLAWVDLADPDWEWDGWDWDDGDSFLIDTEGRIVLQAILHERLHDQYLEDSTSVPFADGWECIHSAEWKYGYVNPAGEMMFGGFVFDVAEPFHNGLARVQYMDDRYEMLDVYINPEGRVVWAEYGKKEEVQHWLDEGIRFSAKNMTLEEAAEALVGEWKDGPGNEWYPLLFNYREDGMVVHMNGETFRWEMQDYRKDPVEDWEWKCFTVVEKEDDSEESVTEDTISFKSRDKMYWVTEQGAVYPFCRAKPGSLETFIENKR